MKKTSLKKITLLSMGKELSKMETKKVLGGSGSYGGGSSTRKCNGCICANSYMSCTSSPISAGYCAAVWPASGGVVLACTYNC